VGTGSARVRWERVVGEFERSGESVRRFAGARGINANTLSWWRWRLRTEATRARTIRFMPVVLERAPEPLDDMGRGAALDTVEATLPNGVVLRFPYRLDREGLRELAATLMGL
jgi:transposase-like protein